jgi:hypothetical protein
MLRKLKLSVAFAVVQLTAAAGLQEAQAADASTQKTTVNIGTAGGQPLSQICTFTSNASYYYSVGRPPAKLQIQWEKTTGTMISYNWDVDPGETWYPYPGNPGTIQQSGTSYYYLVNIGTTCRNAGCLDQTGKPADYTIKGYIAPDVVFGTDAATFAGIWEGVSANWIVAEGTMTDACKLTAAQ